jgi:hypothetical protein
MNCNSDKERLINISKHHLTLTKEGKREIIRVTDNFSGDFKGKTSVTYLKRLIDIFSNDRKLMLEILKNFKLFYYTPLNIKDDEEMVQIAISAEPHNLRYVSDRLRYGNLSVILNAIKRSGTCLKYLNDNLKNNRGIVIEAVKSEWQAIEFASEDLKNDRELILTALRKHRDADDVLEFVPDNIRDDEEIVLEGGLIRFASNRLKNNKEFILKMIMKNKSYTKNLGFEFISKDLLRDKEFILDVIKIDGSLLAYVSKELREDKKVILEAMRNTGYAFGSASKKLRDDEDFVLKAIEINAYNALRYASDRLKKNKKLVAKAYKYGGSIVLKFT